MRRLMALMFGIVLGGGAVYTAFQYHVVRNDQRYLLIPKEHADWREAYVDIRGWTHREWDGHPILAKNVTTAGHGDLVSHSTAGDLFRGLFDFGERHSEGHNLGPEPSR